MSTTVKLDNIIEGIELQTMDSLELVNIKIGKVISVFKRYLRDAEDDKPFEHLIDWQQEEMKLAYDVIENDDKYIALPSEFDIHEYSMIEDFCFSVESSKKKDVLLRVIRGKGAFRRFNDTIMEFDLEEDWCAYRDKCYRQVAAEFCEENGVGYV